MSFSELESCLPPRIRKVKFSPALEGEEGYFLPPIGAMARYKLLPILYSVRSAEHRMAWARRYSVPGTRGTVFHDIHSPGDPH